jgi:hypothetical protein
MRKIIYVDDLVSELHYYDKKQKTDIWMTSEIEEILDNIPVADVVPVVHGHWIVNNKEATCSSCKFTTFEWVEWAFNHCPNCGAKMIKEN